MQLTWKLTTPTKAEYKSTPEKYRTHSHEAGRDSIEHGRIIACYSRHAVTHGFDNAAEVWTPILRNTRGLVFDHNEQVLCRGLPKFFNMGENEIAAWNPTYEALGMVLLEKFNGFCCHIWWDETNQVWRFTTKGGSEHEFEDYGRDLLQRGLCRGFPNNIAGDSKRGMPILDKSKVYIAEGCHDADEHTLKSEPGLYLIGIIDKATWKMTLNLDIYPGEVIPVSTLQDALTLQKDCKHEGYVMYVHDQGRVVDVVKFKSPFYVEMRKQKALLDKKSSDSKIWEQFGVNPDLDVVTYSGLYAQMVLGDFYDDWWTKNRADVMQITALVNVDYQVGRAFASVFEGNDRRSFYELATEQQPDLVGLIMAMFDQNLTKINGCLNKRAKVHAEKVIKPGRIGDDDA